MAKKKEEKGLVVFQDMICEPCWSRHPSRAVSQCQIEIDLGGPVFSAFVEITEQEEHDTKDVPALKKERLREAIEAIYANALEYLNG